MIGIQDKNYCPAINEISEYVRNPVFMEFCSEIREMYQCTEKVEYSSCSWEKGWNIKWKKAGKTLCTLYPKEGFFKVLVVVGQKEKGPVEAVLPECTAALGNLYRETQEGNGQRWLMIDIEDKDGLYQDVFRLIKIRRNS